MPADYLRSPQRTLGVAHSWVTSWVRTCDCGRFGTTCACDVTLLSATMTIGSPREARLVSEGRNAINI